MWRTFGAVIGLSSACLYEKSVNELNKGKFGYYKLQMFDKVFKEKSVPGNFSENYKYVIEEKLKKGKKLPFFYISCGREEELRQINTEFVNYLKELHVKCYYNLSHGEHNWQLWSREIPLVGNFRGSTEKKHELRPACRKLPGLSREKT